MTRKLSILLMALSCLAPAGLAAGFAADARPNIVVFLTDDQGQRDLTPYGGRDFQTPNMQRLAEAGLAFDRAFVASPSCAPSRAALLTGLMPARNGAEPNHAKPRASIRKWPAYFQELGYEVAAFGKVSHYKHTAEYGFDYFAHDTFHDHAAIPAAVEFIQKRQKPGPKPLCILVGSNWPHVPWPKDPEGDPEKLVLPTGSVDTPETRNWRARYAAAVHQADSDLGLVYDAARSALGGNTIYLFSSDHGAQWPFGKWNLYDAGIAVPLIVVWPGAIKPGTRTGAMVSWVDLLPTLLEAAGGKAPPGIDGRSFLPVLRGQSAAHRAEIFTTHSGDGRFNVFPMRSVRSEQWKYIRNLHPEFAFTTHIDLPVELGQRAYFSTWETAAKTNSEAAAILKRYHARPAEELYDLRKDPHEEHNIAGDPRTLKQLEALRRQLDAWMDAQGDQQKVFDKPRFLNNPTSFGAAAR